MALDLKFAHSFEDFEPLESIHERLKSEGLNYSIEELENLLDNLAKKGAIKSLKKNNQKTYSAAVFVIGMFEYQVNKLTKEFAEDTKQYMKDVLALDMAKTPPIQLHTIPVGVTVERDVDVASFDNVIKLLEKADEPIGV